MNVRDSRQQQRLIVVGLDGYDPATAKFFMDCGEMPNLARLIREGATADLDHGNHRLTGLSWHHFATGKSPDVTHRWSAVQFDPKNYLVRQPATSDAPFFAHIKKRFVVFDMPYFDIDRAPNVFGLVNWGAHDPGVKALSRPNNLHDEIERRFGPYPAQEHIYGFVWPDPSATEAASKALTAAVKLRSDVFLWLLKERLPEWEVACVVISEPHSVIEPMWHGLDENHPLSKLPSAALAREGVVSVYRAVDDMLGTLRASFPDAALLAFCMHGMGANNADVASMLLLPEYCYRRAFGAPLFEASPAWQAAYNDRGEAPPLTAGERWEPNVRKCLKHPFLNKLQKRVSKAARKAIADVRAINSGPSFLARLATSSRRQVEDGVNLDWMPATAYIPYWSKMDAFALPAFYDGRIRVNLFGRERIGRIRLADYEKFCAKLAKDLKALIDPATGKAAVRDVKIQSPKNALQLDDTDADLQIIWEQTVILALKGADVDMIGPAPVRRSGGHTGGDGILHVVNGPFEIGHLGRFSGFDVAPTIASMLGEDSLRLTGRSFSPLARPSSDRQNSRR